MKNIGKKISYLLRHNSETLNMDKYGWVSVGEILYYLNISKETLNNIVETNDKKRFSYSDDGKFIRANQGHSIDIDIELEEKQPPLFLFHGTSISFLDSIIKKGIIKMKRNHVHLSDNKETAISVGMRHSVDKKPIILVVDSFHMFKNGYKFYLSKNGVWLTDHIPSEYIKVLKLEKYKK